MDNLFVEILKIVGKCFLCYIVLGTLIGLAFIKVNSYDSVVFLSIVWSITFIVIMTAGLYQIRETIKEHNERQREEEERQAEEQIRYIVPEFDFEYRETEESEDSVEGFIMGY